MDDETASDTSASSSSISGSMSNSGSSRSTASNAFSTSGTSTHAINYNRYNNNNNLNHNRGLSVRKTGDRDSDDNDEDVMYVKKSSHLRNSSSKNCSCTAGNSYYTILLLLLPQLTITVQLIAPLLPFTLSHQLTNFLFHWCPLSLSHHQTHTIYSQWLIERTFCVSLSLLSLERPLYFQLSLPLSSSLRDEYTI